MRHTFFSAALFVALFLFGSTAHADTLHFWHASWYGPGFQGNTMANGKQFLMQDASIAAHKTLPFGTRLLITNPANGKQIIVEVQDRGPFIEGRELDLSKGAAHQLEIIELGVALVIVKVL